METDWVRRVLGELLERIQTTAAQCFRSPTAALLYADSEPAVPGQDPTSPEFRFVSCLAPGTDQLATELAHQHGYRTTALLPVPREHYAEELGASDARNGADQRRDFEAVLANHVDHCLELPGRDPTQFERLDHRYAFAARMLVDHVDLLIAVWSGPAPENQRVRGSLTARVVEIARERNVPVVWIPDREPTASAGDRPIPHRFADALVGGKAWTPSCTLCQDDLTSRLQLLLDPYAPSGSNPADAAGGHAGVDIQKLVRVGFGQRLRSSLGHLAHHLVRVRKRTLLEEWHEHAAVESMHTREHARRESLRRAVEALDHDPRPKPWMSPLVAVSRLLTETSPFARWVRSCGPAERRGMRGGAAQGDRRHVLQRLRDWVLLRDVLRAATGATKLESAATVADMHAMYFMKRYRASFSWTFVLGALAVLLAVAAYLGKSAGLGLGIVYAALEFGTVATILLIFVATHVWNWQARALDTRMVAEALRQSHWLHKALMTLPRPRLSGHLRAPHEPQHWPQWYVQAILREHDLGFREGERRRIVTSADLREVRTAVLTELVLEQKAWYHRKGRQHWIFAQRAHSWEMWIFLAVAAACACAIALCFLPHEAHEQAWYPMAAGLLVVMTASFPAFAAAIHGLCVQAEVESIAKTYQRMVGTLRARAEALADLGEDFTLGDLQREVGLASSAMIAEVQDWHRSYGDHPPPLV